MLARKVAAGAIWLVGARLATRMLDLAAMLIVARLLVPTDFGVFALAASVLMVLDAVTDLSLANALVQMRDPKDEVYDTAFTLSLMRGLFMSLAVAAMALPFARIYGEPQLAPVLFTLACVPTIRALASPRMAHLQRELQFRPAFYVEAAGKLAAFVSSVTMAFLTRSHWALVAGMIATPTISTILSYRLAPYRPAFGLTDGRAIFAFSGWLTLSNAINTLNWQADRFFIGNRLGTAVLGQYAVGSELASLPTNAPILPIMQALYSGFARLSHDIARLRAAYMVSQGTVLALALPIAISVSVFAYPIIQIAIGPEWLTSAFVIQILAPVFAIQMLTAPAQSIAMVTGRTHSIFVRDAVALGVRLPLILIGMYAAGLPGVVWARVCSGLFVIVLNLMLMKRIMGVSVTRQLAAPWRTYLSGLVLAGFLVVVGGYFDLLSTGSIWLAPKIASLVAAGFALYGAVHLALWSLTRPDESAERKLIDIFKSMVLKVQRA